MKQILFTGSTSLLEAARVAYERHDFDDTNILHEECCEMLIRLGKENGDSEDIALLVTALLEFGHIELQFNFLNEAEGLFVKRVIRV